MLLLLAISVIIGLLLLISYFKMNPFVGLILASLVLGLASGMGTTRTIASITAGMGTTLGYITIVLALGMMIGKLMAECGAADVIARRIIEVVGESRVHWAMMFIAFIIGIPVFLQVGVALLIPILFTIALRTGISLITLAVPLIATLSTIHHFVPPHPAVMALIAIFKADLGKTLLLGLLISLPCAIVGGPLYGRWIGSRMMKTPPADMVSKFCGNRREFPNPPGFAVSVFTVLLPVGLMLLAKVADVGLQPGTPVYNLFKFLGEGSISLMTALLVALWTFGFSRSFSREQLQKLTSECMGPVAMILLVIGGGGAFGKILVDSGIAGEIARLAAVWHIHPLMLGWLLSALVRISVGSATVAMTTSAGLVAHLVGPGGISGEMMILAIGSGSCALSHINDSGFWLVKEFFGLTVQETLRTWSVAITVVAFTGIPFLFLLHALGF